MKMTWIGWKIKENCHVLANQFHGNFHYKTFSCGKLKSVHRDLKLCFNASWGFKGFQYNQSGTKSREEENAGSALILNWGLSLHHDNSRAAFPVFSTSPHTLYQIDCWHLHTAVQVTGYLNNKQLLLSHFAGEYPEPTHWYLWYYTCTSVYFYTALSNATKLRCGWHRLKTPGCYICSKVLCCPWLIRPLVYWYWPWSEESSHMSNQSLNIILHWKNMVFSDSV